jgi:16S rRNA (guanine527-N7)-methyltransferase
MADSLLKKYFPELKPSTVEKLNQLLAVFTEWNSKINMVSRKEMDFLEERHLIHSLSILRFNILPVSGQRIIDVGSGGGFPGLPLAICYPENEFLLIDSIGKKMNAVNEIIKELGLTNVKAEKINSREVKQKFDYVLGRAVTNLPDFVAMTQHLFNQNSESAYLYLKGGDFEAELKQITKRKIEPLELSDWFEEEFFETKKLIYLLANKLK